MNQHAEYVSPGHPDRLADAIAESIVTAAVQQKPDALVGVEVAVHADCVFVDGRITAGPRSIDIEEIVRKIYRAAGYGGPWNPDPGKIRVTTDLCQEALSAEESDIRPYSDDQNIVIGYACGNERTNYLPVAHWVSGELGRRLFARLRGNADLSATFGPDFKILASLKVEPGEARVEWRRMVRVPTGQLVQTMINAEMSRLSAREIAQRFLKSIMKQVGVLSGQHLDDDEDDTIPTISAPKSE
jgi:S-adenosylmethionine synthetase